MLIMPFAQSQYTATTGGAVSVSVVVPELATEDVMGSSILTLIVVVAIVVAVPVPALTQENSAQTPAQASPPQTPPQPQLTQPMDSNNRRFVFHRIDGSFLRLDMHTGAVAVCSPAGTDWTCAPGRDERADLDREIAHLQRDNAILKNALLEHGVPLPDGIAPTLPSDAGARGGETIPRPPQTVPPTAATPGTPAPGASPDGKIDRITNAVEKGWRRLVEMMENLLHDLQKKG
jgi:hypothetical protein